MNFVATTAEMIGLRILRLAGCGPECRLERQFSVDYLGDRVTHWCGADAITTVVPRRLREVIDDERTQERLAAWVKAHHAAVRAFEEAA